MDKDGSECSQFGRIWNTNEHAALLELNLAQSQEHDRALAKAVERLEEQASVMLQREKDKHVEAIGRAQAELEQVRAQAEALAEARDELEEVGKEGASGKKRSSNAEEKDSGKKKKKKDKKEEKRESREDKDSADKKKKVIAC